MSESVQGSIVTDTDRVALHAALDEAFGYRGDVTVVTNDGRRIVGYIFDIRSGKALAESFVRVLTASSDERVVVRYDEIQSLEFTGRDTAAGKSWENWLKRYAQKKLAGELAGIDPDHGE